MGLVERTGVTVRQASRMVEGGDDVYGAAVAASPEQVRAAWLAYCREVVTDNAHRGACAALGGSASADGFAPDVRWPGYLGPGYRAGGVLWVANVHRNFDSAGMSRQFADRAADAVRAFRDGGGDTEFLSAMQETYGPGLRGWTVGQWGRKALAELGVDLDDVSYLNAARCQATDTGEDLQRLCQGRWPLRRTVKALQPRLLLLSSLTALNFAGPKDWPCRVVAFSQRNGRLVLTSPWKPRSGALSASVWMAELARVDASEVGGSSSAGREYL